MGLHEAITRAVRDAGYTQATEVQQRAIAPAMAGPGPDGLGQHRQRQDRVVHPAGAAARAGRARRRRASARDKGAVHGPRILVLTPTRELAMQVAKAAVTYGRHVPGPARRHRRRRRALSGAAEGAARSARRADRHAGPPDRPPAERQGACSANVEMLVLDEADRMLDMGFIDDIHLIADAHAEGAPDGDVQRHLRRQRRRAGAPSCCATPQRIDVASHTDTHADIEQRLHWADDHEHKNALLDHILTERERRAGAGLHQHAARRRLAGRPPGRHGPRAWPRCTAACRRAGATACCRACARAS